MKEMPIRSLPGIPFLFGVIVVGLLSGWLVVTGIGPNPDAYGAASGTKILIGVVVGILSFLSLVGLYSIQPNQAAVLSLFGKYVGTVKEAGLRWNNPFYSKRKISQRVRNFESGKLKVNDLDGSPIEIAAGDRVAGGGRVRGGVQRRRLRELRPHPVRGGAAGDGLQLPLRPA
jgi:SPFH domain / Band 7 family.